MSASYCFICGGPIYEDGKHPWLQKLYILSSDGTRISSNNDNYKMTGSIYAGKKEYTIEKFLWYDYGLKTDGYGLVLHQDCHKFIKSTLHHTLDFNSSVNLVDKYGLLKPKQYKQMKPYMEQSFEFDLLTKQDQWLIESPLKNMKNAARIKSIWANLKKPTRKSPSESATYFKINTVKLGNDGNKWAVKKYGDKKKWVLV